MDELSTVCGISLVVNSLLGGSLSWILSYVEKYSMSSSGGGSQNKSPVDWEVLGGLQPPVF